MGEGAAEVVQTHVVDEATQYARQAVAGEIIVGPLVRLACQRHLNDLEQGPARGLSWHPESAQHAIGFIERLRHYQGVHAGRLFLLSPFQKFIVGSIFGWYAAEEHRRFRVSFVEIAKGNGKTPLAAAIALYMLIADGEAGAEVYSAATSRDQAAICFNDAKEFVRACPPLLNRLSVGLSNIAYLATSSFFRPVSAEGRGLDGKRPHGVIVDEVHEHPSAQVIEKMRAGTKGRTRSHIFEITNSGYDQQTVCWEHHDYSVKVLQGVLENDSWFAFIACLDKDDNPFEDETCWLKANPNLGVSVTYEYIREQVREARDLPSKRSLVLRLNFCRWTEASENWVQLDHWDACAAPFEEESLRSRDCYGGLDLASVSDFAALAYIFPPETEEEFWKVLLRLWLPDAAIQKLRDKKRLPIDAWIAAGLVRVTPGNVTDYAFIRQSIAEDREKYNVRELAVDRFNSTQLVTQLMDDGVEIVQFGQGYTSMSTPCKEIERLYMSHRLAHGGNKVLRWMASNVVATCDPAGQIKFDRDKSTNKIDGMVSLAMAVGRAVVKPNEGYVEERIKVL